ncbi:MAG: hypothetical protein ACYTEX_17640 [Planctomycetota bacterium]
MCGNCRSSKRWYGLFLVLLAGALGCPEAVARIVGTAEIMDCIVGDVITCENKKVVTAAVTYGLETEFEVMRDTGEVVKLKLNKTAPVLKYPLKYLHTVSYCPYEKVIKVVDPNTDYSGCLACPNSLCPTCGWQRDDANNPIEDSQGFCAYKRLWEPTCSSWRGEELLGEHSSDANRFSTAHCLQKGQLCFHGYEIGRYAKTYDIDVDVKIGEVEYGTVLSPGSPVTDSVGLWMRAALLGEFTESRGVPELDNYILYIGASPNTHEYVQQYQEHMLLVPREELSKDGSELDKVGIDFYTFRMMGSSASVTEAGDGLHNQLYPKHQTDLDQMIMNPKLDSTYLVRGKRPFKESMEFTSGMDKVLEYEITDIEYSQVQFVMDANSIKQIETEVNGDIQAAVETFESMSNNGVLKATVVNSGEIPAGYIVTVTDASQKILDGIRAKAITLLPGPENAETLTFDIHTAQNVAETHTLTVSLRAQTGRLFQQVNVIFDTTEHDTKYPRQLQMKNEASQVGDPVVVTGDLTCDGRVDYDDLLVFAASWLEDGSFSDLAAWPYCDNLINNHDFSVLARSWMEETM